MNTTRLLTLATLGWMAVASTALGQEGWEIRTTADPVDETVARLTDAIEAGGASVVATVDHAANAATVGTKLPDTTLVIFGNPAAGTPLIMEDRLVAIDLPQKILVWRDGDVTNVGYQRPERLSELYSLDDGDASIEAMSAAMDKLVRAAVASAP